MNKLVLLPPMVLKKFSKYDLYYDVLGIGAAVLIDKWWKPKENSKWERGFSTTGISFYYRLD